MSEAATVIVAGVVLVVLAAVGIVVLESLGDQAEPSNQGLSEGQQSLTDGWASFTSLMGTALVVLMVPVLIVAVAKLGVG